MIEVLIDWTSPHSALIRYPAWQRQNRPATTDVYICRKVLNKLYRLHQMHRYVLHARARPSKPAFLAAFSGVDSEQSVYPLPLRDWEFPQPKPAKGPDSSSRSLV